MVIYGLGHIKPRTPLNKKHTKMDSLRFAATKPIWRRVVIDQT
jgi:hypothetical protein